jgi:hypothetical protein
MIDGDPRYTGRSRRTSRGGDGLPNRGQSANPRDIHLIQFFNFSSRAAMGIARMEEGCRSNPSVVVAKRTKISSAMAERRLHATRRAFSFLRRTTSDLPARVVLQTESLAATTSFPTSIDENESPSKRQRRKILESHGELGVPKVEKKAPTKAQSFQLGARGPLKQ